MPNNIEYAQFGENFIEKTADFLLANYAGKLDKIVCVFGGRRPGLFLRKALAKRIGHGFVGPKIMSIDEFIGFLVEPDAVLKICSALDAAWIVYTAARKKAPMILTDKKTFAEFLPIAAEIVSFIEQLDLECVPDSILLSVQAVAKIGFDVPKSINALLANVVKIRSAYHESLRDQKMWPAGLMYRTAAELSNTVCLNNIDAVVLCGFFYFSLSERKVIKSLLNRGIADILIHGNPNQWDVLARMMSELKIEAKEMHSSISKQPDIQFHAGADIHAQTAIAANLLKGVIDWQDTVVVVPRAKIFVPLLTQIADIPPEFNISLGYPLERTALVELFKNLAICQESRRGKKYYSRDYLRALKHPLVKFVCFNFDSAVIEVICRKIKEALTGGFNSPVSGMLFFELNDIVQCRQIRDRILETLTAEEAERISEQLSAIMSKLHTVLFENWEEVETLGLFGVKLRETLEIFSCHTAIESQPLNLKAMERFFELARQFENVLCRDQKMLNSRLWDIFLRILSGEAIPFLGSPLKGLQILGLLETRSLNFGTVIVIDANETVLPALKLREPLIPRDIMLNLGIDRLEKEEEIQRYQFNRLISAAKKVHLIYADDQEHEKSRFLEELIWQKQKRDNNYIIPPVPRYEFSCAIVENKTRAVKTPELLAYLRTCEYSASRINTYLNCPMRFYFQYGLGLREIEDLLDEPRANTIGDFIHRLLENVLMPFVGKKPVFDSKFQRHFFTVLEERFDQELGRRMRPDALLLKAVLVNRMDKFLRAEQQRPIKEIISLEQETRGTIKLTCGNFGFVCKVDRIDRMESSEILIIDYKTGGANISPRGLEKLRAMEFTRKAVKETIKSLQMPLYLYFLTPCFPRDSMINAELYNLRSLEHKPFIADKDIHGKNEIMEICVNALNMLVEEIFDPNTPFETDPDPIRCPNCPFKGMCR